jgi:hypothetical protein
VFRRCSYGADAGSGDRDDGDEAKALVELEHVGASVEEGLARRTALGVSGGETKVAEGWTTVGRRILRGRLQ